MLVPRRKFLKSGALTALTAGIVLGLPDFTYAKSGCVSNMMPGADLLRGAAAGKLYELRRETFEPYVGTIFNGRGHGRQAALKLVSIRDYEPKPESITKQSIPTESFSLHFKSSRPLSENSIHLLGHESLGEISLFLTCSKCEDGKFSYEAVFNHLKS